MENVSIEQNQFTGGVPMKVLGISGSLRKSGNSEWFLKKTLEFLEQEGLETELVSLRGKTLLPCSGCYGCA